jgi:endonuclease/exonuclease/phosphatase family metal-dependent hydrolase
MTVASNSDPFRSETTMKLSKIWNTETFLEIALPALTTMFGLQLLQVFVPLSVWYLGDSMELDPPLLGAIVLLVFGASFLVIPFHRMLGLRRALRVTLIGIAVIRLFEQLTAVPVLDLALAMLGTILFTFFFPLYLAYVRARGDTAPRKFARGFLLGIVLDTTMYGALHTLDLSWQHSWNAAIWVAAFVAAQLVLIRRFPGCPDVKTDDSFIHSLPLAAVGPFIFVMEVVLQNVARATALTGFPMPIAFAFVLITGAIGIAASLLPIIPDRQTIFAMLIGAGFLAFLSSRPEPQPGTADVLYFFGNLLLFPFITLTFSGLAQSERPGVARAGISNGIGWLIFGLFLQLYYVSYDLRFGFRNTPLVPIAIILIGLATILAMRRMPQWLAASNWTSAAVAFALCIVPLIILIGWRDPKPITGQGYPVRVMSYNLHNGFQVDGQLDPERLAQTIEQAHPDVVGLQEVERGRLIDGSLDLATWLSRRLQMPFVYGPTADPVWGNAILSRYPIKQWGNVPLPPNDLLVRRGFIWARIDVGGGEEMLFVATHLHHVESDSTIRQLQSTEIIKFWNHRPRTIIAGTLNAKPDAAEIAVFRNAGLKDTFGNTGFGDGLTFPSANPVERIDYIWFSSDLMASDFGVPKNVASDHLAIEVTVEPSKK